MSGGIACNCFGEGKARRSPSVRKEHWEVIQRNCNHSSFNGNRRASSRYSSVRCKKCGACWRTKAPYVDYLPDMQPVDAPKSISEADAIRMDQTDKWR